MLEKHISYLVRRNDCVVIPGLGAFLCQYYSAQFDDSGVSILPPGRKLAFNRWLSDDDGLLCSSVAKANSISVSEARDMIRGEVEDIHYRLSVGGSVVFGNLGTFFIESSSREIKFRCNSALPGINGALYGLQPVTPLLLLDTHKFSVAHRDASGDGVKTSDNNDDNVRHIVWFPQQWRAYASGVVATLAVFVTLIFFVMSPIQIEKNTQSASIAPISSMIHEPAASSDGPFAEEIVSGQVVHRHVLSDDSDDTVEAVVNGMSESDLTVSIDSTERMGSAESSVTDIRFFVDDPYIVVVASFPTLSQAEIFMNEKRNMRLGVEHMGGRFRVYAATGNNYSTASRMMELVGQADAWICRK